MLKKILLTLFLLFSTYGCGNSSSQSNTQISISGIVAVAPVANSIVSIYSATANAEQDQLLGTTYTDSNGMYKISIDSSSNLSNGIIAIASGGAYVDVATGNKTNLSNLQAFSNILANQTINITPISTAVLNITKSLLQQQGLNSAFTIATQEANSYIGANINTALSLSFQTAQSNNDCQSIQNWLTLTAISKYQANNSASLQQAISELTNEISFGNPISSLGGLNPSTIAYAYFQNSQNINLSQCNNNQVNYSTCGNATDYSAQMAAPSFSSTKLTWSDTTVGPYAASYPQTVCNNYQWQRERVMYAYENIAVPQKWNYCHHHSAYWFPGKALSYDQSNGSTNNGPTLYSSLYCSSHSFYDTNGTDISNYSTPLDFRNNAALAVINNAYRWNSNFAQANVPNWNSIVAKETQPGAMGAYLSQLYPSTVKLIDTSWFNYSSGIFTLAQNANLNQNQVPLSEPYQLQTTNKFLNGVDCSDLTGWVYLIGINTYFNTGIATQAGQRSTGAYAGATAQQLCLNQSQQTTASAGYFLTYNGQVVNSALIGNNNLSPILNALAPGDLLFIQNGLNSPAQDVAHVITWTGKKVGMPGTGVTNTTVALDLIAPATATSGTGRVLGDWVIIDAHFQGADYRDFSGWYANSLWGVRRVIGSSAPTCFK